MESFLLEVTRYFDRYTNPFIRACKEIQQLAPPDWARSGTFWLQHEDGFDDQLPLSLQWHDGQSGFGNEGEDPLRSITTEPWRYGDSPEWPSRVVHPGWEVEEAMRLRICDWIRSCWIRSGGRGYRMRFYVSVYASNEDYCLERGRFVTQAELNSDLKDV